MTAYLFEVKKPEESKYPGDDYKLRATIPAARGVRPLRRATVRWSAAKLITGGDGRRGSDGRVGRGMFEIFGIPSQALFGQLLLGLINGSFYALLSLGLAVIFGMLNIINFAHGAQYMMGAFAAYLLLQYLGINYWAALVIAPIVIGATGIVIERLFPPAFAQARSVCTGCCSRSVWRSSSRACSATITARPGCRIRCRRRCKADAISASCSCRITAPG